MSPAGAGRRGDVVRRARDRQDGAPLAKVPTLADVAQRPDLIDELPTSGCAALIVQAGVIQQRLAARIAVAPPPVTFSATPEILTAKTAAARLGIARPTLYRKVRTDPDYRALLVDNGARPLRCDVKKLDALLRRSAVP